MYNNATFMLKDINNVNYNPQNSCTTVLAVQLLYLLFV